MAAIKNEMVKLKKVGYQERHIEKYYKDIITMQE
ncbi:hypothetical protein J2S19_001539 [Metabacillus malikii]|uniref:Integrase n=1 Tax=Metabacillus malikii TaxID=1504265 RepID=A0ABT9ZGA9_9BACI|nr:hypothetical protein [Metabacillus malikii]